MGKFIYNPMSLDTKILQLFGDILTDKLRNSSSSFNHHWETSAANACTKIHTQEAGWAFFDANGFIAWGDCDTIHSFRPYYSAHPEWPNNHDQSTNVILMSELIWYIQHNLVTSFLVVARPGSKIRLMDSPIIDIHVYHPMSGNEGMDLRNDLRSIDFIYQYPKRRSPCEPTGDDRSIEFIYQPGSSSSIQSSGGG